MGEPITVTTEMLRRLGMLLCTQKEAAAFLGLTFMQFRRMLRKSPEARQAWDNGLEGGKVSLRRKQMRLASSSAAMAIFLGKNYLGQRDAVSNELTGKDGEPMRFSGKIRVEFVSATKK